MKNVLSKMGRGCKHCEGPRKKKTQGELGWRAIIGGSGRKRWSVFEGASSCTEGQGMAGCLESKLSVSLFFGKQKQGGALEGGAV